MFREGQLELKSLSEALSSANSIPSSRYSFNADELVPQHLSECAALSSPTPA